MNDEEIITGLMLLRNTSETWGDVYYWEVLGSAIKRLESLQSPSRNLVDKDLLVQQIHELQESLETNDDVKWKRNKPIHKGLCYAVGIINNAPVIEGVDNE